MKKHFLAILITAFTSLSSYAIKVEGKIIFENDTLNATINVPFKLFATDPNYEHMQYRIKYFDKSGKKVTVWPTEAKEIQFRYNTKTIRMLSVENTVGGNVFLARNKIFLKLEKDGKLKLFSCYLTRRSMGTYNPSTGMTTGSYAYTVERFLLQKGNDTPKQPKTLSFKKDMAEYFSDCPELVKLIESKELRKGEMERIVDFYNLRCGDGE